MPSRLGYQPRWVPSCRSWRSASPTPTPAPSHRSRQCMCRRRFTDPAAVHTFSHLSASIVLSRKRASEGLFPAIDPLQSSSKMPRRHRGRAALRLAQEIRRTLAQYAELKDIMPCSALNSFRRRTATSSPVPPVGAISHSAVLHDRAVHWPQRKAGQPQGGARRLRANPARRIQGLPGERLHDRAIDEAKGKAKPGPPAAPTQLTEDRSKAPRSLRPVSRKCHVRADPKPG